MKWRIIDLISKKAAFNRTSSISGIWSNSQLWPKVIPNMVLFQPWIACLNIDMSGHHACLKE